MPQRDSEPNLGLLHSETKAITELRTRAGSVKKESGLLPQFERFAPPHFTTLMGEFSKGGFRAYAPMNKV